MVIHLFPFETINVVFCSSVHLLSSSVFVCYFLFFLCFENVALIDQRSLCSTRLLDFYSLHCQWNLFTNCQIWFLEVVGTRWRLSLKVSNVQYLLCILLPMSLTECSITIICNGESPGLVVMGGDSCSKGCGFESRHRIRMDGHFFTYICCKNCNDACLKSLKIKGKSGRGWPIYKKLCNACNNALWLDVVNNVTSALLQGNILTLF